MREWRTETVDPADVREEAEARPLENGRVISNRYAIQGLLGAGGSSFVYAAEDRQLGVRVALKVLRPDRVTAAAMTRLRRELAIAQRVESPHVVRIYDTGEGETGPFIVMEAVEGESLRARLRRGPLAVSEATSIICDVLEGLQSLHACGVTHRDVKPGNILLGPSGSAKIGDFGLARDFAPNEVRATQTDAIVGTVEYLSPEQVLGRVPDARSDLYSVGVVLYEALTGELPFRTTSSLGTLLAHVKETPRDLRRRRSEVPVWLARVVSRLLEKNPAHRFPGAAETLEAIRRRRAPIAVRQRHWLAFALLMSIACSVGIWRIQTRRNESFFSLVRDGDTAAQAIDRRGRVLWRRADLVPHLAVPSTVHGKTRIAAFLGSPHGYMPVAKRNRLSFLDPSNGEVVDSMLLPDASNFFPQFANEFGLDIVAVTDLNHDGNHEVIASYQHTYWPSFTVIVDPAVRSSRIVFVASGHHRLFGTVDLNRDGRDELLLGGIINKMGWYSGVAAIDPGPIVPASYEAMANPMGGTPDSEYATSMDRALAWYALLPRGQPGLGAASVDNEARRIDIRYPDGRVFRLDFDGFRIGERSSLPPFERVAARDRAYKALRIAERATVRGDHDGALAECDRARSLAAAAGDGTLVEWVDRVTLRILIRASRRSEATVLLTRLMSSEAADDIAFEAAREMHGAGDLENAARWYRQGMLGASNMTGGRLKYQYLEGALLAFVAMGRFEDARAVVEQFCAAYPVQCIHRDVYESYIRWRSGLRVDGRAAGGNIDLYRYWALEFRRASGESLVTLLPDVQRETARNGSVTPLLQSLLADCLLDTGRPEEADAAIDESIAWLSRSRATEPYAAAHASLIEARHRRISSR